MPQVDHDTKLRWLLVNIGEYSRRRSGAALVAVLVV
jgi:hypothetical protein